MPNVLSKLPDIIGAWIGMAIGIFLMPLFFLPAFLFGWIMWDWASPAAIYSFIYDKTLMILIGVALLLFLIWTEGLRHRWMRHMPWPNSSTRRRTLGGYGATTLTGTEISSKPTGAFTTLRSRKTRLLRTCSNTCLRCIGAIRRRCHSSPNGWRFCMSAATFEAAMSGILVTDR